MKIEPLSESNIDEAINVANKIFPDAANDDKNSPKLGYGASLNPEKYKDFWKRFNLAYLEYFVAMDEKTEKIIGITGLYNRYIDSENVWIGWFGVRSDYRRLGLGKDLLQWTIDKALEKNFSAIRLYTSTNPKESVAQKLYDKFGFKIIDKANLPKEIKKEAEWIDADYEVIFRELKL
jgi:GNAT superfamily N-acetyltransferase